MIERGLVEATESRYEERTEARAALRQTVSEGRLLDVDEPDRIAKRLARLAPVAGTAATSPAEMLVADVVVLERLIGTNDLMGAGFLARGASAARSVSPASSSEPGPSSSMGSVPASSSLPACS